MNRIVLDRGVTLNGDRTKLYDLPQCKIYNGGVAVGLMIVVSLYLSLCLSKNNFGFSGEIVQFYWFLPGRPENYEIISKYTLFLILWPRELRGYPKYKVRRSVGRWFIALAAGRN